MPSYQLRKSPTPSKRRAESEEAEQTMQAVKRQRLSPVPTGKEEIVLNAEERKGKTPQTKRSRPAKRRTRKDSGTVLPTTDLQVTPPTAEQGSLPATTSDTALPTIEQGSLVSSKPTPQTIPMPQKKPLLRRPSKVSTPSAPPARTDNSHSNPTIRPSTHRPSIDIHKTRAAASSRGPQLTPNGLGIDLSPGSLSSPETPDALQNLPPLIGGIPSPTKHITYLEKRIRRGKSPPCYWPFDIVSGGKPPNLGPEEEKFWMERAGYQALHTKTFVTCGLPDRYGKMWRCPRVLVEGWGEVGWKSERRRGRDGVGRREGKVVSPRTFPNMDQQTEEEYRAFERDVEVLLKALEGGK
ncbi:unnamed protein product [Zymoseptoria tritici ST99CH_3D7]|uniref:Uncharacterized protein n=2 Tax=Zymoseptoria tritici TaxID=1047171 RepID=F9XJC3_ZYMTI|nr:uncharacterized protein MYCGRDRAFT_95824 [Zymoseptoria tritici IPO323]EGP84428.1 hypothetical protein MYCGRDRAFT_95824 [Zymoseptoria tritici IPO323]SMQ54187.1 unnamed protein product [Zymoseptoria tritici ST99CH_3D7]